VGVLYATGPGFVPALDLAAYGAAAQAGTFPAATARADIVDPPDMTPPRWSKPLIVAVQGQTKRAGHELFLAAGVRVAASDTAFAQDQALLGLYPGGGATVRLVREIGHGNAMRLMLTGQAWDAEQAQRYGLVQAVTPPGQQLEHALEFARKIAMAAPPGVRATITAVHRYEQEGEAAAFPALRPELARPMTTQDFRETVRALAEQRTPAYHGR
jgi:enoyl-CoA hydratase/carnithine racemase